MQLLQRKGIQQRMVCNYFVTNIEGNELSYMYLLTVKMYIIAANNFT